MAKGYWIARIDVTDPEAIQASIVRREIAQSEAKQKEEQMKLQLHHGGKK